MKWLEPTGTSISVVNMTSFIVGKKRKRLLPDNGNPKIYDKRGRYYNRR